MSNTNIPRWSEKDVERETGGLLKAKTLAHWRLIGTGPKFYKIGRMVRYVPSDIEAFLLAKPVEVGK